jgi:hypothetical protein
MKALSSSEISFASLRSAREVFLCSPKGFSHRENPFGEHEKWISWPTAKSIVFLNARRKGFCHAKTFSASIQ